MANGTIMPDPWFTGMDDNGNPIVGGKLYTYMAGSSVPLATYTDANLQVAHPNPAILDGGGRVSVFLLPTTYKFVLKTADDVTIRTQDDISAMAGFAVDLDLSGVAGEALFAGSVVYLSAGLDGTTAGRWYLADADLSSKSSLADFVAMSPASVAAGAVGRFRLQGRTTVPGTLTVGATYYVSQVAGGLVTPAPVAPAFVRLVGIADTTKTLVSATGFGNSTIISGDVNIGGNTNVDGQLSVDNDIVLTGNYSVRRNTTDGADSGVLNISGGGGPFGTPHDNTRGSYINLYGNEFGGGVDGAISIGAGNVAAGNINFGLGTALGGVMFHSGGFAWGSTTDPGAGQFSAPAITATTLSVVVIRPNTVDGSDNQFIKLCGGGGDDFTRGGQVIVYGNEHAGHGDVELLAGLPTGAIVFSTGGTQSGMVHPSGALSWGGNAVAHPDATTIYMALPGVLPSPGAKWTRMEGGAYLASNPGVALTAVMAFYNGFDANPRGGIRTSGPDCLFVNLSDATLKTDLGIPLETRVLPRLIVHDFQWKADNRLGRGVFAQEVADVLPEAVSAPIDDTDKWMVDYSKMVPELIVGWQEHERRIISLLERLEGLESRHDGKQAP